MIKILVLVSMAFYFVGCASKLEKENEAKDMSEMKLDKEATISGDDKVGLKDNKFKVQKKVLLAEELRRLENETYGLEYKVYGNSEYGTKGLYGAYRDCKAEENSVEYGGTGKLAPIEPPAPVINEEAKFEFGVDEKGEMVGVTEEFLSERIVRFKKYRKLLDKRLGEYETKLRICENDVKQAKLKKESASK